MVNHSIVKSHCQVSNLFAPEIGVNYSGNQHQLVTGIDFRVWHTDSQRCAKFTLRWYHTGILYKWVPYKTDCAIGQQQVWRHQGRSRWGHSVILDKHLYHYYKLPSLLTWFCYSFYPFFGVRVGHSGPIQCFFPVFFLLQWSELNLIIDDRKENNFTSFQSSVQVTAYGKWKGKKG